MMHAKKLNKVFTNKPQRVFPIDTSDSIKKKITLIYTGGTIGISEKLSGDTFKSEGTGDVLYNILLDKHPEIRNEYDLEFKRHISLLSENILPQDWGDISNSIASEINGGVDGIVVAHGTDSLPYTTAAVSFILSEIPIPVVFTGSLVPPDRKGTDAIQNLYDSILFSADSKLAGVYVVFKAKGNFRGIYSGSRLLPIPPHGKYFNSVDRKYVGKIKNGAIETVSNRYPIKNKSGIKVTTNKEINPHVAFFKIYPGFNPEYIEKAFECGAKGIILNLFHSGTACTRSGKYSNYSLVPVIKKLEKQVLIFGIPLSYSKKNGIYNTTDKLLESGLIPLKAMSSQSAIVKLMWVLGHQENRELIINEMNTDIAGEIITNKK